MTMNTAVLIRGQGAAVKENKQGDYEKIHNTKRS